jgi:hypothetical protein
MKNSHFFAALLLVGVVGVPATKASAERINQNSAKANKAFDRCEGSGSATVESGGVTSCIDRQGHGIVCGGPKPEHKGTCDTFIRVRKDPWHLTAVEFTRMKAARHPKR